MSEIHIQSGKCLGCKIPQCVTGCPVGYNIPLFLRQAKADDIAAAQKTVGHIFGEICGYVCPREKQCRGHCVLNKRGTPVDVGLAEREVFARGFALNVESDVLEGIKVGVVGGGAGGLTFAAEAYRNGASVTVFEKTELLRTIKSIPDFRLPRAAVDRVESAIEKSGICLIKRDIDKNSIEELRRDFDVVYVAVGAMKSNTMNVAGEEYATSGDEFLRGSVFGNAIIIGGGNTAMDCARLNARNGFATIVAYRRSRGEMPAFDSEVEAAISENVKFEYNIAPMSVEKRGGEIVVKFAKTVSVDRGKLTLTDEFRELRCDILVLALGNRYDGSIFDGKYIAVDENFRVMGGSDKGGAVFAGGDAAGGTLVSHAVSHALRAFGEVLSSAEKYKRHV